MFEIPTVPALIDEARKGLLVAGDGLRRSDDEVGARVIGGGLGGVYGYQKWAVRQMNPFDCDDDVLFAVHVPLWLAEGRRAAVVGVGWGLVRGSPGRSVFSGTQLVRADGALYQVIVGCTLDGTGHGTVKVEAQQAGFAANAAGGTWLTFVQPVDGVEMDVQLDVHGISDGADIESGQSVRERISMRQKTGGRVGKVADWAEWALEWPGVTRVWVAPKALGLGTLSVYFMRDGDGSPFPNEVECAALRCYLESSGVPFGEIYALSPIDKPIDLKLHVTPDTPEVRQAVTASLTEAIRSQASPFARGVDGLPLYPITGVTVLRSHLTEAISDATGEEDHLLLMPVADVQCEIGSLPRLGVIEWI